MRQIRDNVARTRREVLKSQQAAAAATHYSSYPGFIVLAVQSEPGGSTYRMLGFYSEVLAPKECREVRLRLVDLGAEALGSNWRAALPGMGSGSPDVL